MKSLSVKGSEHFYHEVAADKSDAPCIVWAHGWGQSHKGLFSLIPAFEGSFRHIMIDFPGFGESPEPPEAWSTKDYADAMAELIDTLELGSVLWVGHSFGCRVGLQMAAHYPEKIRGMCFIGGAGLKAPRPFLKSLYLKGRIALFKACKKLIPLGLNEEWLRARFGSRDYKNSSGVMRQIFIKVVNEDLVEEAEQATCPTLLLYGSDDTEAPPSIGLKLNALMPHSLYKELEGQDHYTVLSSGRHAVIKSFNSFIKDNKFDKV